jgi:hypothetical protein
VKDVHDVGSPLSGWSFFPVGLLSGWSSFRLVLGKRLESLRREGRVYDWTIQCAFLPPPVSAVSDLSAVSDSNAVSSRSHGRTLWRCGDSRRDAVSQLQRAGAWQAAEAIEITQGCVYLLAEQKRSRHVGYAGYDYLVSRN